MPQRARECIFCQIISGDAPSYVVYEDPRIVAFLDKYPLTEGHTLIVTRTHYERFDEVPVEVLNDLFVAVQKLNKRVKERLGMEATHIGVNDGRAANQLVPHVHVHIIPRRENDNVAFNSRKLASPEEMEAIRRKLAE